MDVTAAIELVRQRAGDDVLARVLATVGDGETLLLSGSLIEGLGNPRSDLDLYIVSSTRPPQTSVQMALAGLSYVDIEHVRPASLHDLAAQVNGVDAADLTGLARLERPQLDRYYRFAIAVPLRGNSDDHEASVAPFSVEAAGRALCLWAILQAAAYGARARIAVLGENPPAAAIYANYAAHLAVTAALTDAGEAYPSLKWTLEKAARAYGADSPQLAVLTRLLYPGLNTPGYLDTVLDYVQRELAARLPSLETVRRVSIDPATAVSGTVAAGSAALVTRKATHRTLPEDVAVLGELLSLDEFKAYGDAGRAAQVPANEAAAHQLVVTAALQRWGLCVDPERAA